MPEATRRKRALPGSFLTAAALAVVLAAGVRAPGQTSYRLESGSWRAATRPAPGSPDAALQRIRRQLARDRLAAAQSAATAWLRKHAGHPATAEAYLLRGDAKKGRRLFYEALFDYEKLIREYPDSKHYHTALERELAIAKRFSSGLKRRFLGLRILPAYGEAEEIMIRIQERAPGSALGERASIALADHYFRRAEMGNAAAAYDIFLENYPESGRRRHAMERLIHANLARFGGPRFNATPLIEARERLSAFRADFPDAAERMGAEAIERRIESSLAEKALHNARWYETRGETISAVTMYRRVVRDHPTTPAARKALERLERLGHPFEDAPATAPAAGSATP